MLATAWWWLPLLLLGRYSVPFLDYIENATITTVPTDLARTLVGESDWVAYFAGIDFQAGQQLVVDAVPHARRRRGGRARAGRHRAARQPAPTLPHPRPAHRPGPGRLRVRRRPGRLLRRRPGRGARRRAGAAAQPAQVRRGAAHPAGARARARDGGAAEAAAQPGVARRHPRRDPRGAGHGGARAGRPGAALGTGPDRAAAGRRRGAGVLVPRRELPGRHTTTARSRSRSRPRRSVSTPGATPTTTCCRGWPRARGRSAT